ncbi:Cytochrome oxidase biogenesis protein Cox11-CtaG, copper delivery to Cox1 [hydrothermal vent metagenome]|uniref:Cytochrome oxidase biogenesis protein Cox11-CtaG, copper delivery to Cox1 n=1 Tax=hydrothermal vent metagenome TaxID=652676 RepID=A0A3B0ZQK7_9ZZZZ
MTDTRKANLITLRTTILIVIVMFGFGYALTLLYDLICDKFGFNGKTQRVNLTEATKFKVDKTRTLTVILDSNVNSALPWKFYPKKSKITVHPGEITRVVYVAKNISSKTITGQATYNVTPPGAARFFKKSDCFCFTKQKLKPGETKEMIVLFTIDPRVSKKINTLYLSYTFFNISKYLKK